MPFKCPVATHRDQELAGCKTVGLGRQSLISKKHFLVTNNVVPCYLSYILNTSILLIIVKETYATGWTKGHASGKHGFQLLVWYLHRDSWRTTCAMLPTILWLGEALQQDHRSAERHPPMAHSPEGKGAETLERSRPNFFAALAPLWLWPQTLGSPHACRTVKWSKPKNPEFSGCSQSRKHCCALSGVTPKWLACVGLV